MRTWNAINLKNSLRSRADAFQFSDKPLFGLPVLLETVRNDVRTILDPQRLGHRGSLKGVSQQLLTELNTFDSRMEETSNFVFLYFYATCSLESGHSLGTHNA
jgi:hypothetical protein